MSPSASGPTSFCGDPHIGAGHCSFNSSAIFLGFDSLSGCFVLGSVAFGVWVELEELGWASDSGLLFGKILLGGGGGGKGAVCVLPQGTLGGVGNLRGGSPVAGALGNGSMAGASSSKCGYELGVYIEYAQRFRPGRHACRYIYT